MKKTLIEEFELQNSGRNINFIPDYDVFKDKELLDKLRSTIIQKLIKELEEQQENYKKVNNESEVVVLQKQIDFCKTFLPKALSKDEIKKIILSLEDKSVPFVMKHFKANYTGSCDMRDVQEVLKSL